MEFLEINTWEVIHAYFRDHKNYLTKHHLDSYNDFIINKIPQTFKQFNPLIIYLGEKDETSGNFAYTISVYFGGKNGDEVYLTQDKFFDFMSKRGVISPQSVEGGSLHGSIEAEILENPSLSVANIALMTVAKFIEEEKPYFEYVENY